MSKFELEKTYISITGAREHNLKNLDVEIERGKITVITGMSGSGKSSLAFDTLLAEAQRRFFYTLSHYTRQFLDLGTRPAVSSVTGLSPAIALAQNETQPSVRATVGTLTDTSELIGVLLARFGKKLCPTHEVSAAGSDIQTITEQMTAQHAGKIVGISAPIVEKKKGIFRKQLTSFAEKGYLRALIDGEMSALDPIPSLNRDIKHSISILIDSVKVDENKLGRIQRSLEKALELGNGVGEYFILTKEGKPSSKQGPSKFSTKDGCPTCGFSWPNLDSRYFSINSLGACSSCNGLGYITDEDTMEEGMHEVLPCKTCNGSGFKAELNAIRFAGKSAAQLHNLTVNELIEFFNAIDQKVHTDNPACLRLLQEISRNLKAIEAIGLGYLQLSRRVRSLSGGEAQRLRLSGVIGENLRGVIYVLDEPSQGLSQEEISTLWENIQNLKSTGNTIVIVDHDAEVIKRADKIIDLGPEGGRNGGSINAIFSPKDAGKYKKKSKTAEYILKSNKTLKISSKRPPYTEWLKIKGACIHNLDIPLVQFPLGQLSVVTGPSGAGKTSLVMHTITRNLTAQGMQNGKFNHCKAIDIDRQIERTLVVDRKPIARSSVSMPATYLDIFTDLRQLFAKLPESQIIGLTTRSFSLATDDGRCEECKGRGLLSLSMKFLADAKIKCPTCQGTRYKPHINDIRFKGYSISDVLNLTIDEALDLFSSFKRITRKLKPAVDLGLGYLSLGQPSASLSGGESQRLKLVPYLSKTTDSSTLMILDEPTRGLHFTDVEKLMTQLRTITDTGASVIIIEHDQQVIESANWLVQLGPGAGDKGGQLTGMGIPIVS